MNTPREGIAIIGMAGRFPQARTFEEFWRNLSEGRDCVTDYSDDDLLAAGVDPALLRDPGYVKARFALEDADQFDATFFGISPVEAEVLDPQQRVLLECAREALDDAGYDPASFDGSIGLYAGAAFNTYYASNLRSNPAVVARAGALTVELGNDKDYLATRVAYKLDLRGPSLTVQTACSTSLVAVHLACEALHNGECEMALAGGVSIRTPLVGGYDYEEGSLVSPDGRCRPFDARAEGTSFGDGVGLVVLKRLEDALADGDTIHAIVKGTAINNDGALKVGYTAPSIDGQAAVIAEAQAVAGVEPDTIDYIETHGTGTLVGDPIEIAALTRVFRSSTERSGFCALGALKGNIGHLNTAAGVAGLIKTVLSLEHGQITPAAHFDEPNPKIDFAASPFYVNTALRDWPRNGHPRRAGVSAFGIGGTNAHAVVEEAPLPAPSGPSRPWLLLPISARSEVALEAAGDRLAAHLREHPDLDLADVAYTLQVGRRGFAHRRFVVCHTAEEAIAALETRDPRRAPSGLVEGGPAAVAFMFPGQGAQYVHMAGDVYRHEPVFREHLDRCAALLEPHLGLDLRTVLYPAESESADGAARLLGQTRITQPALFAVEYALAQLWQSWGLRPQALIGHSIGEYVAACLAGVFSLEDAIRLVATRGRLMQDLPPGAMLSVPLAEAELRPLLDPSVSLAAVNGPAQCVVSGPSEAIEALAQRLEDQEIESRRLHTSHAFHSAMMDPILAPFTELVARLNLQPPRIPFVSNVSGTWATAEQATDPRYWATHLRQTVRFADGLSALLGERDRVLLEVGPGRTLATFARLHPQRSERQSVIPSLRHPNDADPDAAVLLGALGKVWLAGASITWPAVTAGERRQRVRLPAYPFQRQRFWVDPRPASESVSRDEAATRRRPDMADWFYTPSWRRRPTPASPPALGDDACWLVFVDRTGLASKLVQRLRTAGQSVIAVMPGEQLSAFGNDLYAIGPERAEDYAALLDELAAQGRRPRRIVHLWSLGPQASDAEQAQRLGFASLLRLVQALGALQAEDESPIELLVGTSGVQEVTGDETLSPASATALGVCAIAPYEYPHLVCRAVDLSLPAADGLAERVLAEFGAPSEERVVALRGRHRWVQDFSSVRIEAPDAATPLPLRQGGTYLITGGLGGIGLQLAEELARSAQANLVLVARTPLPEPVAWDAWLRSHSPRDRTSRAIRRLQAIRALGGHVLTVAADVTDREAMRQAVQLAHDRFGPLAGVIHAAGVPAGGVIQLKTLEAAAAVMAPKVQGTLVLDEVLRDESLDFLMLCSSLFAVVGQLGQVDYCAANTFLDAYAHAATANGRRVVAINWPGWRDVGMLARTLAGPEATGERERVTSRPSLAPQPLAHEDVRVGPDERVRATTVSADGTWLLDEHRISGTAVFPATGYLELIRSAVDASEGAGGVEINDATFMVPLVVPDGEGRVIYTSLQRTADGFHVTLSSAKHVDDDWQDHLVADVRCPTDATPRRDLAALRQRCSQPADLEVGQEGGPFDFGPRFSCLREVHLGTREGLASIELPAEFGADLGHVGMHPALLDLATRFLLPYVVDDPHLPVQYRRVGVYAPLPASLISYARVNPASDTDTLIFDADLLAEDGTVLVEVEGFTLKRLPDLELRFGGQPATSAARTGLPDTATELAMAIAPDEGVSVFRRILAAASVGPQVTVSTTSLPALLEYSRATAHAAQAESADAGARPAHPRPNVASTYVEPRTETERVLARLWQDVLGLAQVGVEDNFFELGGDSVSALRVVTGAKKAGIVLSPQQLFKCPTVAQLAAAAPTPATASSAAPAAVGPLPLGPIHAQLLLGLDPEAAEHLVASGAIEVPATLDVDGATRALRALVDRHDALRLRLLTADGDDHTPRLLIAPDSPIHVRLYRLEPAPLAQVADDLAAACSLRNGPVVAAALVERGPAQPRLLVLGVHVLAIDAASWPLVMGELAELCRGGTQLPPLAMTFADWAAELAAPSTEEADPAPWLDGPLDRLPSAASLEHNTVGSTASVTLLLDPEDTRAVCDELPTSVRMEPREVLLAALVRAIGSQGGPSSLAVYLEADVRGAERAGLIGCGTAMVPLRLDDAPPERLLRQVKERARAAAARGLDWARLRAPDADAALVAQLAASQPADVCLRWRSIVDLPARVSGRRPDARRPYVLEVIAAPLGDRLSITVEFSTRLHQQSAMEQLLASLRAALQALIAHARAGQGPVVTAADFPAAALSEAELDTILARLA